MAASSSDAVPPVGDSSFEPDFGPNSGDELEAQQHVKEEPPKSPSLGQPEDTSSLAPIVTACLHRDTKVSEFEKSRPMVPWVKCTQDRLDKEDARHREVYGPGHGGWVGAMAAYVRTDDADDGILADCSIVGADHLQGDAAAAARELELRSII